MCIFLVGAVYKVKVLLSQCQITEVHWFKLPLEEMKVNVKILIWNLLEKRVKVIKINNTLWL